MNKNVKNKVKIKVKDRIDLEPAICNNMEMVNGDHQFQARSKSLAIARTAARCRVFCVDTLVSNIKPSDAVKMRWQCRQVIRLLRRLGYLMPRDAGRPPRHDRNCRWVTDAARLHLLETIENSMSPVINKWDEGKKSDLASGNSDYIQGLSDQMLGRPTRAVELLVDKRWMTLGDDRTLDFDRSQNQLAVPLDVFVKTGIAPIKKLP